MGMTVSSQASYYYNLYTADSAADSSGISVDPSAVSQQYYHISDLTGALNALNQVPSLGSVGDAQSMAQSLLQVNQLSDYGEYEDALNHSSDMQLLTGNADFSGLSGILNMNTSAAMQLMQLQVNSSVPAGSAVDTYKSYLAGSSASGVLNLLT